MTTEKYTVGPYTLHEKLGSHRRHHVYRAVHDPTGQEFACKLINISKKVEPQSAIQKVQLEARILQRLDHPHLVKIVDAGVRDGKLFIIMERIEGETLAAILTRRGKLPWDLATEYARRIAEGLNYIHQQELVHLKLNPDKVIIAPDGKPKIVDLRLNRAKKRRWDEAQQRVLDVAAYMAPEQMTDEGGTHKSDIYSVGILLYEMITGRLPFEPDTLPRLLRAKQTTQPPSVSSQVIDCPTWLDQLIQRMLQPDPAKRPHSMHAIVAALREVERMRSDSTSMTEQLTRGFNPLTAGKDKSEARRILGKEAFESSTDPQPQRLNLQLLSTIGIAAGLLLTLSLMAGGFYLALKPPSEKKLYRRAVAQMDKQESEQTLLAAKRHLQPLIELYPEGPYAEDAKARMEEVVANLAERRMKRRHRFGRDPKNEAEALCVTAWQLAELGDLSKAVEIYRQAASLSRDTESDSDTNTNGDVNTDSNVKADSQGDETILIPIPQNYNFENDEDEHIQFRILARLRAQEFEEMLAESNQQKREADADSDASLADEDELQIRRLSIEEKIAQAKRLEIEGKVVESRRIMRTLIDGFGDDPDVADLIDPLEAMMRNEANQ